MSTPDEIRAEMFEKFPEELQVLAKALVVRKMQVVVLKKRLEDATEKMTKARNELEELMTDINDAEITLRNAIEQYGKERL